MRISTPWRVSEFGCKYIEEWRNPSIDDVFQKFPLFNSNTLSVYDIVNNHITEDFIDNIIGINIEAFTARFSSLFGKRAVSENIRFALNLHEEYDHPLEFYNNYNPFSNDIQKGMWSFAKAPFMTDLATQCGNQYGVSWKKLYEAFIAEYDVLKPYKVTVDDKGSDTLNSENSNTQNGESAFENEATDNETRSNNDNVFGFNSATAVPSNKEDSQRNNTSSNGGSDSFSNTNDTTYTRSNSYDRLLVREGNIGNTSPPELIEKEISLRKKLLWGIVTADLAEFLTKPYYVKRRNKYGE